jgi:phosphoglycolate/pyridoxal phosphate phosphatase family enzyme
MSARGLHDFAGYIFDLDGTVYLGEHLLPGAEQALASLRAAGKHVAFISNNPLGRASEYVAKLNDLGVHASPEEVINSAGALRLSLSEKRPGAHVFLIGEEPVREELTAGGFVLTDSPQEAEVVVVSWDRQVTYAQLNQAFAALRRGAYFVATHPDVTCPLPGGSEWLDAGAFIALFEAAIGRKVDAIAGKPSPLMLEVILHQWGLPPSECLLVGDRLETDIALGRRAGVATALVLTGVTSPDQATAHPRQPDFILQSIAELA